MIDKGSDPYWSFDVKQMEDPALAGFFLAETILRKPKYVNIAEGMLNQ
jgi:hypothetical protein